MTERGYKNMTKKRPFRGVKLFIKEHFNKPTLFKVLAKIGLVKEVKKHLTTPILNNEALNKVRLNDKPFTTSRGKFDLSYYAEGLIIIDQWWYESRFSKKPKRLYTIMDWSKSYVKMLAKADCIEFLARFDPFNEVRVCRNAPRVMLFPHQPHRPLGMGSPVSVKYEEKYLDFFSARVSIEVKSVACSPSQRDITDSVNECLKEATKRMKTYLENNASEMNEKLTGVKNDGQLMSPDGNTLLPNCVCSRCSFPVFKTTTDGYTAQCVMCDEDLYEMEIRKLDPKAYEDAYKWTKEVLYHHLRKE